MTLHVDIETFSSVDIASAGAHKYIASPDFEIILVAWAVDNGRVQSERVHNNTLPEALLLLLKDDSVTVCAHNAAFERTAFARIGVEVAIERWYCTAVKAAYCGLPRSLSDVSKALQLEFAKKSSGAALIRYFCLPCKPTKTNGGRLRNYPEHNAQKWAEFVEYCKFDVLAEREIHQRLHHIAIPADEREMYVVDQRINDRGVMLDLPFVDGAIELAEVAKELLIAEMVRLTGLSNPASVAQLKGWVEKEAYIDVPSLNKKDLPEVLAQIEDATVLRVMELRGLTSKSSIKKYHAMAACAMADNRARGAFLFYGANRTGRWSGRLIQLQNMTKNKIEDPADIAIARRLITEKKVLDLTLLYGDVPSILSQLTRTALVPKPDHRFVVVDFSAIEARVLAWLAKESWRLDVFKSHGRIYEASASMMFGVPMAEVTKDLRAKGKVSELALGYQGSVGALMAMGGEAMGLSEAEMKSIVWRWRDANPRIVNLWTQMEKAAVYVVKTKRAVKMGMCDVVFGWDTLTGSLWMQLPSGRRLYYFGADLYKNQWDKEAVRYWGVDQKTRQWSRQYAYGGKFVENCTQAVARDIMADLIMRTEPSYNVVMHVHDELVAEVPSAMSAFALNNILNELIPDAPIWAQGLPLSGAGFITDFYCKD